MMDATTQFSDVTPQQTITGPRTESPPISVATAPPETSAPEPPVPMSKEERRREILRVATQLFQQKPDWITYFREVLGVSGVTRRLFLTPEELFEFEQTEEYFEVQRMLAKLRGKSSPPPDDDEPTRVITVRLPKSLHESLRTEAHDRHTSMNKLCISKLLQMIDKGLIPTE